MGAAFTWMRVWWERGGRSETGGKGNQGRCYGDDRGEGAEALRICED